MILGVTCTGLDVVFSYNCLTSYGTACQTTYPNSVTVRCTPKSKPSFLNFTVTCGSDGQWVDNNRTCYTVDFKNDFLAQAPTTPVTTQAQILTTTPYNG